MDNAVALVQAYLRVNGYFTVAEYPIIEAAAGNVHRTVTDLDILAFRFPHAGHSSGKIVGAEMLTIDPVLDTGFGGDMLVGR